MKKLFTTIAAMGLLAVFCVNVEAQSTRIGVKAGGSLSNLVGSDVGGEGNLVQGGSKFGLHGGAYLSYGITEKIAIQPEVLYSMKGSRSEETTDFGGQEATAVSTFSLDYISIPVLGQYWITEGFNVYVGPQIGFGISGESKTEWENVPDQFSGQFQSNTNDFTDDMNMDIGGVAGLGYELENGLRFYGRYNFGLTPVINNSDGDDADVKNSVFQVGVGYSFMK